MVDRTKIFAKEKLDTKKFANTDFGYVVPEIGDLYKIHNHRDKATLNMYNSANGVYIDGSIRKWYLGSHSLRDLTRTEIKTVCEKISEITGLSVKALLKAIICILEFGLTFYMSVLPATLLESMYRYSSFKLGRFDTSISFRGYDYWLVGYDKSIEIQKWGANNLVIPKDTNALRLELKAFARSAFDRKLRKVETLEDVIVQYQKLIMSFYVEIKKLEMSSINHITDDVKVTVSTASELNRYLKYKGIKAIGERKTSLAINSLSDSNRAKSYHRKVMREILAEYSHKSDYSNFNFLREIAKQLTVKLHEPLPVL